MLVVGVGPQLDPRQPSASTRRLSRATAAFLSPCPLSIPVSPGAALAPAGTIGYTGILPGACRPAWNSVRESHEAAFCQSQLFELVAAGLARSEAFRHSLRRRDGALERRWLAGDHPPEVAERPRASPLRWRRGYSREHRHH